jgi:hypothetical protein
MSCPRLRGGQGRRPTLSEVLRVSQVEVAGVFVAVKAYEVGALPDARPAQPTQDSFAAAIRLHHHVDSGDVGEVWSVAFFPPGRGARYTKSGDVVEPERMTVALALDEHYVARLVSLGQPRETVERRLRSGAPAKAVVVTARFAKRKAKTDG